MKPTLVLCLFALSGAAALSAEKSAPPRQEIAAPAAKAGAALAGNYTGTWKGPEATGGDLRLTLKLDSGVPFVTAAVFTFEGAEVPMKMKSMQADGTKVVLVFDWAIDGSSGQSTLTGELVGDKLAGTYQTKTETPTSGTWSVARR